MHLSFGYRRILVFLNLVAFLFWIFIIAMALIHQKLVRQTNYHHWWFALTQRDWLSIHHICSYLNTVSALSVDVLSTALVLVHLLATDPNLTPSSVSMFMLLALLMDLFEDMKQSMADQIVWLVLIEYTLEENRYLARFSRPRRQFIRDLDHIWSRKFTQFSKQQLSCLLIHLHIPKDIIWDDDEGRVHREPEESCLIVTLVIIL